MRERFERGRAWLRDHASRRTAAIAGGGIVALALLLALVVVGLAPRPSGQAGPSASATAPEITGSALPSAAASTPPSPSVPGEWAALQLPPYEPIAELVPDVRDGSGISTTGSFTLRSLTSTPAVELAAGLVVEPVVDLRAEAGSSPDVAVVHLVSPLVENARYEFRLRGTDGALAGEWTFRTGGPLHVVRRLPDDRSTQVPVDTGIEIEFDQDDVVDVAGHFSIEPAVEGRFETHGRTWAFVPSSGLEPATLYTVTLTAGVGIRDSEEVLETDVRFAFETAGPREPLAEVRIAFDRPMHEARPDEAPVVPVQVYGGTGEAQATTRDVVVYGLGTLDVAREAAAILALDRDWAIWSANGGVPTEGLTRTATFEATVGLDWSNQYLQLPTGLGAGWYLLEVPQEGRDAQLVLQVTDLAAYVLVSEARTIAWVNDLGPEAPVANASVISSDGSSLGRTDAAGLLDRATPASLVADIGEAGDPRLIVVSAPDGRSILAAPGTQSSWYWGPGSSSRWWLLFGTDRDQYRRNDTIHAWGLVRSRSDRSVPSGLELRLVSGWNADGPPIARTSVTATARGVVVGDLPVRELPAGWYTVALYVGEEPVSRASISVTEIRKPTFQVEVTSERRAFIDGEQIHVQAAANFFDGSTAPGLQLRVTASGVRGEDEQVVAIDATGAAEVTFEAATSETSMESGAISASPAQPEEGSSYGNASFVVFPSTAWIDAEAALEGNTVTISGQLTHVDLAASDRQMATGWVEDPSGEPFPGRRVEIVVDRVTWRPVQVGTTYDFVLKRTVPLLRYEREVEPLGTFAQTSDATGAFVQSLRFDGGGGVEVTLRATDEAGRAIEQRVWAERPSPPATASFPYLETAAYGCGSAASLSATVGENVSLTVRSGAGEPSVEGRTLFVVGHLGIDDVVLTSGADLQRVFDENDLPSLTVRAIRFTNAGYLVTNDVVVRVGERDRAIEVLVEPSRDRYAPGDEATVSVTTTRADGSPIAADVVLQAIDLKLFAIGAAHEISTAGLMAPVSSGFRDSYVTHAVPPPSGGDGCGATTGGGEPRDDFEDAATFQLLATGSDGRGEATFRMPHDLTSWVVSATAMGEGLESGTSSVEVPVGLPFFVDATVAPEYLVGEEPILQVRAYGDALEADDRVRFTIEAPSIGLDATTIEGRAFEPIRAPLPALAAGEHDVTISGARIGPGTELSDAVRRTVRVVPTRLRTTRTASEIVSDLLRPQGGDGLTTYVVTDAGRGGLVPLLQQLATGSSARFDASLAAELAREILIDEFGVSESSLPPSGFGGTALHPPDGLALLPYSSADLYLTARTALVAPERVAMEDLGAALRSAADEASSRERRIVALAGLAGLDHDVLGELRAAATDDLTVRERAWLALGLLASGDEAEARSIERAILTQYGQRLDRWVRLEVGAATPERAEVTASVLLLAAGLRDPIAADISRYLIDNPAQEYLPALEQIGFARSALDWLPREEARFAWTVDGERHEEILERGAAFTVSLTAAQRESLVVERLDGELIVTSTWTGEARYGELPADSTVTIRRAVAPADHAPSDDLVRVTLDVRFDEAAPDGCYQVTDLVPSGLAPVVSPLAYWNDDPTVITPYEVEGQRVSWCVTNDRASVRLGYAARVVSAGTYRWEPAVIQHAAATSIGAATAVMTYTVD